MKKRFISSILALCMVLTMLAPAALAAEKTQQIKTAVASGYNTAAITSDNELYIWGKNNSGQVGIGTTEDEYVPTKILENVASVSLGGAWCSQNIGSASHNAAITINGDLYVWGNNGYNQISSGIADKTIPNKILSNVSSVSLGSYHSAAISNNGELYVWGYNSSGQIGNGSTNTQSTPAKILQEIASVNLAGYSSAAISTDGDLYVWGENRYGIVGNGKSGSSSIAQSEPYKVMDNVASVEFNSGFGYGTTNIAAITKEGELYVWGYNSHGQVGNGSTKTQATPAKVLDNVTDVSIGHSHIAAITTNGDLYVWGSNEYGQVGNGSGDDQTAPVKILSGVSSVSLGYDFSAAVLKNGDLYVWGYNQYGGIGTGTTEAQTTPMKILNNVSAINMSGATGTAITEDGALYVWGLNSSGQAGTGSKGNVSNPQKILPTTTTESSHLLSYDLDGGSGDISVAQSYVSGSTVLITSTIPTKEGYIFNGWSDGSSMYQAGQTFTMPEKDVRLTAVWTPSGNGGGSASITNLYPANGATEVGYGANSPKKFQITFNKEIANDGAIAQVDLSKSGAFSVYRVSDDQPVYQSTQYSTHNFLIVYQQENILSIASTELDPGTEYYITLDAGIVQFKDGTTNSAITKGEWQFYTDLSPIEADVTMKASDDAPRVSVSSTWNDNWFKNSASMTYYHELARSAMALSGAAYVEDSTGLPRSNSVQEALKKFGFDTFDTHNYDDDYYNALSETNNDHVAYTFALKEIQYSPNETTYLIAVVVKGTSGNEEWYSNFNIGTGDTHAGFKTAAEEVMDSLNEYLKANHIDTADKNAVKFLITGHSRGAAVANLVAAELTTKTVLNKSTKAYGSNVYGYTFATPTVSTKAKESGYENIFNIISGEDFVTQVPLSKWGFKHYGIDFLLPSRSYYDSTTYDLIYEKQMSPVYESLVKKAFEQYKEGTQAVDSLKQNVFSLASTTQEFYSKNHYLVFSPASGIITPATTSQYFGFLADALVKFNKGLEVVLPGSQLIASLDGDYAQITLFFIENHIMIKSRVFSAHSMAGYYSWLSSCSAEELFGVCNTSTYATFKRLTIACPVDVYVYNCGGTVVASVINEAIVVDTLAVNVEDGVKTIDLPNDQEYSIKIVATDEGSVSYTVEEMAAEGIGDSVLRNVIFNDIDINTDDELTGKVNDILYTDKNNYVLTKNNTDKIYADYDSYNPSVNPNPTYPSNGGGGTTSATNEISVPSTTGGTVTVSPKSASKGSTITITATPDSGYELVSLTVTGADGTNIDVSNTSNGKYTFTMPSAKVTVNAVFSKTWSNPFTDVATNAWYYDAVKFANQNGLMDGVGNGLFAPNANLSRAMLAQILYNKEGRPIVTTTSSFSDVVAGAWYANAVTWAATKNIVGGYGNGLFGPSDDITREQFAVILYRYAGSPVPPNLLLDFTDAYKVSDWAQDAIRWAVDQGILNGKGNGILDPTGKATRAEAAQMLKNYFGQ